MARTSNVFARVEPEIKEQAEEILDQLGIPMSNAVGMFLRQVVLQRGIPFEMKLPRREPLSHIPIPERGLLGFSREDISLSVLPSSFLRLPRFLLLRSPLR